jgi:hypothetical protein
MKLVKRNSLLLIGMKKLNNVNVTTNLNGNGMKNQLRTSVNVLIIVVQMVNLLLMMVNVMKVVLNKLYHLEMNYTVYKA